MIQYNNRFEMCLWIYQGGPFPLSLELPLISNKGQFSLIFCTITIFGKILELCYLETLKKIRLKIFAIKCRHSLRTVGDSLKEHNSPLFFTFLLLFNFFLYHKYLYIYYPSCSLSDLCMYDTGYITLYKLQN